MNAVKDPWLAVAHDHDHGEARPLSYYKKIDRLTPAPGTEVRQRGEKEARWSARKRDAVCIVEPEVSDRIHDRTSGTRGTV